MIDDTLVQCDCDERELDCPHRKTLTALLDGLRDALLDAGWIDGDAPQRALAELRRRVSP